jgi:serine/threonine-protein kinase
VDNEPADDVPEPSKPAAAGTAPTSAAAPRTKPAATGAARADEHGGGGGWRSWGHGVEGPLAIAALVVAVIALLVGTAGLVEARRADTKKSQPAKSSSSSGQIAVPNMVGETGVNATVKLKAANLQSKNVRQASPTVAKGRVISQDPAAGTKVAEQTLVTLTVSDGPASASGAPPSS